VVKVKPTGVEVQTGGELLQFGNDGYELDTCRRNRLGFGPNPIDQFLPFFGQFLSAHLGIWTTCPSQSARLSLKRQALSSRNSDDMFIPVILIGILITSVQIGRTEC
jgi:hypothetical protein